MLPGCVLGSDWLGFAGEEEQLQKYCRLSLATEGGVGVGGRGSGGYLGRCARLGDSRGPGASDAPLCDQGGAWARRTHTQLELEPLAVCAFTCIQCSRPCTQKPALQTCLQPLLSIVEAIRCAFPSESVL